MTIDVIGEELNGKYPTFKIDIAELITEEVGYHWYSKRQVFGKEVLDYLDKWSAAIEAERAHVLSHGVYDENR